MSNCKPCKPTYNNRLSESKQINKAEESVKDCNIEVNVEKDNKLNSTNCGKEITSITQINDTVIVIYADCSYTTVDKSKVVLDNFTEDKLICIAKAIKKIDERLQILEASKDSNIVYNDKELRDRITALENKPNTNTIYDDSGLRTQINNIIESIPDISGLATKTELTNGLNGKVNVADLVIVENLEGTKDLFKAVKLD